MRPIDADALRIVTRGKNHHRKYVYADITDAPTIGVIPVEWLKQQFYDNQNTAWANKCQDVYTGWLRWQMWQKEQEAQDG